MSANQTLTNLIDYPSPTSVMTILKKLGVTDFMEDKQIPVIQSGVWVTVAPVTLLGKSITGAPTFTDIPQPMTLVMATIPTKSSLPTSMMRATRKKSTLTNFMEEKETPDIH